MTKTKKLAKAVIPLLAVGGVMAVYLLGWFSTPKPWEQATGWQHVHPESRPTVTSQTVPGGPRVFWLGHSSMLLQWGDVTLVLDPNTSASCSVSRRILEPALPVVELGPIDAALVSHAHYDHMDIPTLQGFSELREIILPRGSEVFLPEACRHNATVQPLGLGETHTVGDVRVTAVPAAHFGNRFHPLRSRYLAVGYVIARGDVTVYVAGDTAIHNDFADIRETYHPDIAILPIGAYAPYFPLHWHHLSPEEAAGVGQALGAAMTIPCHFGTFTLSFDRPHHALPRFAEAARERELHWIMPQLLQEANTWRTLPQMAAHYSGREPGRY